MGRPSLNRPADSFTRTECEVGPALPPRSMELLNRVDLAPPTAVDALWDTAGFIEVVVTGAFNGAGLALLSAARLARLVASELRSKRGNIDSNLERFYLRSPTFKIDWTLAEGLGTRLPSEAEPFWLHHVLSQIPGYRRFEALSGDFCIDIADRQYVFLTTGDVPARSSPSTVEPLCRITGWSVGRNDASITHVAAEWTEGWSDPGTKANAAANAVELEYQNANRNAVSVTRVNISLAIRNAFDRIRDYRASKKTSVDLTATISKPRPVKETSIDGWQADLLKKQRR